ncbi:MAG TPA: ATP-binding cassette domain-containing protein, partial [Microthrixaceae bacterium]|nr:ATP-binding cassette domain-containing protein [Microthrixaceae bacterium]
MSNTPPPFQTSASNPPPPAQVAWAAQVLNAFKIYGSGENEVRALNGVTVGFERGRFTAIMGPSGSGKSTLMQCAAGLDKLTYGDAVVGDVNISQLGERALTLLRRERIGFIFQQFNLLPTLTAKENILFPLTLAGRSPDTAWMDHVVSTVGLRDRLSHKPSELS